MIFVTGDTHGSIDFDKILDFNKQNKLTKDDYLIICGDFGGLWYGLPKDLDLLNRFEELDETILFVDGNHENFDKLKSFPVEIWNGGKVHRIMDHVIHLMRGQVFNIDGSTFFTFGGALSIDKGLRKEHISWWSDEWPSEEEMNEAINNLSKVNYKVDYVLTHACPKSVTSEFISSYKSYKICKTEVFLDEILNKIKYKKWFFGHYHIDEKLENYNMIALYYDFIRIEN